MTDASAAGACPPVILWFRNDRHLADQPALQAALPAGSARALAAFATLKHGAAASLDVAGS